jgi:hypothetical protein
MPMLTWSRSIAAGAQDTPIQALAWQYQYLPWPANVKVGQKTTATGVTQAISSGSQQIMETSVIQVLATAGVTPSELNTPFVYFAAAGGDFLKITNTNTTAGALVVDGIIVAEPAF